MARINIEDCWWIDPRREVLITLVGGSCMADGAAMKMWRLAQEFWKNGRQPIPEEIFNSLQFASELLRSGLAVLRGASVYVRGSSQYLEWLHDKSRAGSEGGKKSVETRRKKYGNAQPKSPKNVEADSKQTRSRLKQTEPSSSSSSSSSFSKELSERAISGEIPRLEPVFEQELQKEIPEEQKITEQLRDLIPTPDEKVPKRKAPLGENQTSIKARQFIAAYVKAYQSRFPEGRPEDLNDPKVRGQILNWVKDYPLDRACELIQVYFQLDTRWFGTKGYDFTTFRCNLNKIAQALDSGKDPDGGTTDWERIRTMATNSLKAIL